MNKLIFNERTGKWIEYPPYPCKMCGQYEVQHGHDICNICGWQDDGVQNADRDFWGGANKLNYNQYKIIWQNNKEQIMQADFAYKFELIEKITTQAKKDGFI